MEVLVGGVGCVGIEVVEVVEVDAEVDVDVAAGEVTDTNLTLSCCLRYDSSSTSVLRSMIAPESIVGVSTVGFTSDSTMLPQAPYCRKVKS